MNSIKTHAQSQGLESIITPIPTGAKSTEQILKALDKFRVEWYVTEEGALMIKYWQVAADDFVPREKAAIIRATRPSPEESDELDWLSKNLENIRQVYGGQWVAVHGNKIVAAAASLPDLMILITDLERPFITFIPSDSIVWTFAYAS